MSLNSNGSVRCDGCGRLSNHKHGDYTNPDGSAGNINSRGSNDYPQDFCDECARSWTVVSVPGREEDGSDTVWFAWNPLTRDSVTGPTRREAAEIMRQMNSR